MKWLSTIIKDRFYSLRRFSIEDAFMNFLIVITIIAILAPFISFFFAGTEKTLFAWLVLYIPFVWFVWIISTVLYISRKRLYKLMVIWFAIDISALLFFLSFSMGMSHWERSNGADIVVYVTYFPVIVPSNMFVNLAPTVLIDISSIIREYFVNLFPYAIQGVMSIWFSMSALAVFQSIFIIACAILLKKIILNIGRKSN